MLESPEAVELFATFRRCLLTPLAAQVNCSFGVLVVEIFVKHGSVLPSSLNDYVEDPLLLFGTQGVIFGLE